MEEENRWRILAIDDHEDTLDVIRMTLSEEYDVVTLNDPVEVYEIINIFEPDLLILDIMMPKITGFKVLELLQKNPTYKDLPVIILSAKDSTREIKYGYKLGARLYLTKPFDPGRLLKNVKLLFERTPPARGQKKFNLKEVLIQLHLKKSYESGAMSFDSSLLETDKIKMDEVKKAVEEAKKRQNKGLDNKKWMD